jgi:hypothetical protein
MPTKHSTIDTACRWCGYAAGLDPISEHVHIANAQASMEHAIGRCPQCERATAVARWGNSVRFDYRVVEYKRMFRRSNWVAVYDVTCAWCGSKATEPAEINVTVANPVSERFRYDLYSCRTCDRATAISYLGELRTHCAVRDEVYRSLWYLDPP